MRKFEIGIPTLLLILPLAIACGSGNNYESPTAAPPPGGVTGSLIYSGTTTVVGAVPRENCIARTFEENGDYPDLVLSLPPEAAGAFQGSWTSTYFRSQNEALSYELRSWGYDIRFAPDNRHSLSRTFSGCEGESGDITFTRLRLLEVPDPAAIVLRGAAKLEFEILESNGSRTTIVIDLQINLQRYG